MSAQSVTTTSTLAGISLRSTERATKPVVPGSTVTTTSGWRRAINWLSRGPPTISPTQLKRGPLGGRLVTSKTKRQPRGKRLVSVGVHPRKA